MKSDDIILKTSEKFELRVSLYLLA